MSTEWVTAIAASASAVAAIASWRSSRSANQIAKRDVLPILTGRLDREDDAIHIKNNGRGPALNFHIQKNSLHYTDKKLIYEFSTKTGSVTSIMPGEERKLQLRLADTKGKTDLDSTFAAFEYYFNMGSAKYVALTYKDLHGTKYISYLKASPEEDGYPLDLIKTRRYSTFRKLWDWITIKWFRSKPLKWWREFKESNKK